MNRRRAIWLLVTFVVVFFLFFGIPTHIYHARPFLIFAMGTAAFFICGYQFLSDFESFNEIKQSTSLEKKTIPKETQLFSTMFLPALIFFWGLFIYQKNEKTKVLKTKGAVTKGIVVHGESVSTSSIKHRTRTTYNISVTYSDLLGNNYVLSESIDRNKYKHIFEGAVVDVVYLQDYPEIAEILIGVDDLNKYLEIPTGCLKIGHLLSILERRKSNDSVLNYLNRINYQWTLNDSGTVCTNERLEMSIKVVSCGLDFEQKSIVNSKQDEEDFSCQFGFEKDLTRKGFIKNETVGVNTSMAFYNDKYTIKKETKRKKKLLESGKVVNIEYYDVYQIRKILE